VQKIRQSERKQRIKMIKIKRTSDKIAPKKFKQVIYLRKGKPTKGKADAKKVNKQTRKTEKSMQR
jgi:hypothetical protein